MSASAEHRAGHGASFDGAVVSVVDQRAACTAGTRWRSAVVTTAVLAQQPTGTAKPT